MILMKRRLAVNGFIFLSQIISANVDGRINNRMIHNNKMLERIRKSKTYQNIVNNKYSTLEKAGKEDTILALLSSLINTDFTLVDYDEPDRLGDALYCDFDTLAQEFLDFVNSI